MIEILQENSEFRFREPTQSAPPTDPLGCGPGRRSAHSLCSPTQSACGSSAGANSGSLSFRYLASYWLGRSVGGNRELACGCSANANPGKMACDINPPNNCSFRLRPHIPVSPELGTFRRTTIAREPPVEDVSQCVRGQVQQMQHNIVTWHASSNVTSPPRDDAIM